MIASFIENISKKYYQEHAKFYSGNIMPIRKEEIEFNADKERIRWIGDSPAIFLINLVWSP